jgi:WD40 repeat protein
MTDPQPSTASPATLRLVQNIPEPGWRDGTWMSSSHFAVAGDEGVWAYDVTQHEPRRGQLGTSGDVTALVFVPATRTLALGDRDGQVHSNELGSGRAGFHADTGLGAIRALAADPAGRRIAAAGDAGVCIIDLATGHEWRLGEQRRAAAWLGDGVFATLGQGGVEVWDCETRGRVVSIPGNAGLVVALEYLAAPQIIAAALSNGEVAFWSMAEDPPQPRGVIRQPDGLSALAIAPDGLTLATASPAGAVRLWRDFAPEPPPAVDAGSPVLALRFAADGQRLAAVTRAGISLFAMEG